MGVNPWGLRPSAGGICLSTLLIGAGANGACSQARRGKSGGRQANLGITRRGVLLASALGVIWSLCRNPFPQRHRGLRHCGQAGPSQSTPRHRPYSASYCAWRRSVVNVAAERARVLWQAAALGNARRAFGLTAADPVSASFRAKSIVFLLLALNDPCCTSYWRLRLRSLMVFFRRNPRSCCSAK